MATTTPQLQKLLPRAKAPKFSFPIDLAALQSQGRGCVVTELNGKDLEWYVLGSSSVKLRITSVR